MVSVESWIAIRGAHDAPYVSDQNRRSGSGSMGAGEC